MEFWDIWIGQHQHQVLAENFPPSFHREKSAHTSNRKVWEQSSVRECSLFIRKISGTLLTQNCVMIIYSKWRTRKIVQLNSPCCWTKHIICFKTWEAERRARKRQVISSVVERSLLLFSFLLSLGSGILFVWIFSLSDSQFFLQRQKNGHLGVYFFLFSFFRFQLTNLVTLET